MESDQIEVRLKSIALQVRRRRVLPFIAGGVFLALFLGLLVTSGVQRAAESERIERIAKEDFQATWCEAFGEGVSDEEALRLLKQFISRNRDYLESQEQLHLYTFEGERVLHIEDTVDYFIEEPKKTPDFVPFEGEIENSLQFPTVEHLATGTNEFGKPALLPCD